MDAVRDKWTDERLDDLNGKVDDLGRIDRLTWVMTTTMVTGFLTLAGLIVERT